MKTYLFIFSLLIASLSFSQSSGKEFNQIIEEATKANKPILLVHVNSDDMQSFLEKRLSSLSDTFKIHFLNISGDTNAKDKLDVHNRRYNAHYNPDLVYPTINILDKKAQKTGVSFSGATTTELDKFINSLKAY